jgi:hypothetical protein
MWIPTNLIRYRIMGKDRIEPCKCGHFHRGKEVILPEVTPIAYMDMLVAKTKAEGTMEKVLEFQKNPRFKEIPAHWLDK